MLMGDDVEMPQALHPDQRQGRAVPRHLMSDQTPRHRRPTTGDGPGRRQPPSSPSRSRRRWSAPSSTTPCRSSSARALPDARDGLKPVHRRILWGMYDLGRPARPPAHEVRPGHRRRHGQVPPPRRRRDLRRPGAHGPGLLAAPPARRRPRQLRLARLSARRRALHRVPARPASPCTCSTASTRTPSTSSTTTRATITEPVGAAVALPEPAGQRQPGHRGRHGHQHPAAQPGRGHRRHRPPDRQPRRHARRPDAVREGPRLPHRRARSWAARASSTPTAPARARSSLRAVAEIEEGTAQSDQIVVTEMPYQTSSSHRRPPRSRSWSRPARSRASPTSTTSRPGGKTRLVIELKKDAPGARHPQQPLQAHPAADELRGEHRGPGRRRAPHAQPRAGAAGLRRPPGRGHPPALRVPPRQGPGPGPHRRGPAQGHRHDRRDHRHHPGLRRHAPAPATALMAEPFEFTEIQAEHILDMPLRPAHPPGPRSTSRRRWPSCARPSPSSRRSSATRPSCARSSRTSWARSRSKFATPRRTEITFDTGRHRTSRTSSTTRSSSSRMSRQGLHQDGAGRRVPHPGPRRPRRGRRQAARRGLRHPHPHTTAHAYLLFFSNRGRVYRLKAHEIPMKERTARGTAIVNLLPLQPDETIQAIIDTRDYETNRFLFFATKQGPGQEDQVHRVRLVAAGRAHRHQPARRRRAGRRSSPPTAATTSSWSVQAGPGHPLQPRTTCGPWAAPPPACGA